MINKQSQKPGQEVGHHRKGTSLEFWQLRVLGSPLIPLVPCSCVTLGT